MQAKEIRETEGLLLISEHGDITGLDHWVDELEQRRIPGVIKVREDTIDNHCSIVRNICQRGFEIGGSLTELPFWGKPYTYQYEEINRLKNKIQSCTGRTMRIFSSRYFAYDENTLKVADELSISYILARGAVGVRAAVYRAREYSPTIIFVSNVPSKEMGTGSLCDVSMWSRGETPNDLRETLFNLSETKIVLVSHTHIGGIKLSWWNVYREFLDANLIAWKTLDEFAASPIELPIALIPTNTEVKYRIPKPKTPLEQEPNIDGRSV